MFHHKLGIHDYKAKILRAQLNRLPPKSRIRVHSDMGWYAANAHRYHIPIIASKCIRFMQKVMGGSNRTEISDDGFDEIPVFEGEVFEVNNNIAHYVNQSGDFDRVTLIVDLLDQPSDAAVEIHRDCNSWFEKVCYKDANLSASEFWTESPS